jgi:glycosyltransferase involved in cell wall biosynthesis/predicted O-methyltransferase YrrM
MHRSGTSLVSSLLQAGGVHVGDNLLAANHSNPRGYFEDVDFIDFHERLLSERQQHYLHVNCDFEFDPSDSETERARELVAERSKAALWGWKDPRTSLFLDFWQKQLPDARFLFLYRHPLEVMLSLLRRGEFDERHALVTGLQAWHAYNARIKAFYDRRPDRCLLVHIEGVAAHFEKFALLLRDKLQLDIPLGAQTFDSIYHAQELAKNHLPKQAGAILEKATPGLLDLYAELNARADLPPDTSRPAAEPSPLLSSLTDFAATVPEPVSLDVQHSLLLMLSSSVAPEATEKLIHRSRPFKTQTTSSGPTNTQVARNCIRQLPGFERVYNSPAQMRMPERVALYSMIFGIQPRNCLEIGTARGGSASIICGAMDDLGFGRLSCVDPAPQVDPALWAQINHRCQMFVGTSPGILPEALESAGARFDFALIDGDHNFEAVRADIANVLPYLTNQAYVLFHDAHNDGVKRAIDEAVAKSTELTDCGLMSVESTILQENGHWSIWAGLRLLRYERSAKSVAVTVPLRKTNPTNKRWDPGQATGNASGLSIEQPARRTPVILAGIQCLSGVTTWAERLRRELKDHSRYDVRLLHVGPERPAEYDLYADTVDQARTLVRDFAPAIVVPNYVWELYLAGCDPGISCLGMCHADSLKEYYLPLAWYESRITQFIAVSPECAHQLAERIPFRAKDITTLPYGVRVPRDLARDYSTAPVRIIYAGRLAQQQKRVGDFVRLVEHLLRAQVPFVFDIVGDGEELAPLQHAMQHWFPAAQVRFHGRVAPEVVDVMWSAADVFVQTSDFEGTSVSMLEAMAHGVVPVVTAASSGVAGVIEHGQNGFVVPVGDMAAMAEVIAKLSASQPLLAATGRAAYESAQPYAMEAYCERFIEVLDRVVSAAPAADQLKCEGGFGGYHPLFLQQHLIRSQQAELATLRSRQFKFKMLRKLIRSIRKRLPGHRMQNQQSHNPARSDRKAA